AEVIADAAPVRTTRAAAEVAIIRFILGILFYGAKMSRRRLVLISFASCPADTNQIRDAVRKFEFTKTHTANHAFLP
ncbi:hypothetical protein, partial [Cognatishimia sp. WU-CL00825]|uniref:hypothetical protein n=1 Tax=Cognatishimia sp. WU-CL00825 TaxID=3127658 RepID=UPI003365510D